MNQYNSYYLYQQFEKRGSQDWLPSYPNIFSVDGDGTMPLVMKKENDPDCGYTGDTEPIYRWYPLPITTDYICDECPAVTYRWENMDVSTDYYCDGTTKYYKQIRQYSYDSGQTWYDVTPPEYRQGSVYEQQSTDCGYIEPIYRWAKTDDVTCVWIENQYRTTSGESYCDGYDKYVDVYSQVSYDGGITWSTTATTPTLVEHNSVQCGYIEPQYRTTSGTPYCSGETGYDKYIDIYSQVSYDGGITWETTATTTSLVETQSADCGFVPKLVATYRNGTTYQIACDENTTLTTGNTRNAGGSYTAMTNAVIGDCVTTIGRSAFTNCYSITSVTIPDSVTSIEFAAFSGCTGLTSIVIPDSVTSIGDASFGSCTGLTSCTIGSGVTSIGASAFTDCSGLTSIAIPDSVTSIGNNAFYQCTGLTSCTIGSGLTSIGDFAFYFCTGLTSVTIPDGITSIGDRAFQYCGGLTSINIPSGSIGKSAFYSCSDITSCTIGNSVTSIGGGAFQWCTDLTSVTVNATTPPTLGAGAFAGVDYNCKIIVPTCSLVNTYRSANVWSSYSSMITALDCPVLTTKYNVTSTSSPTRIASGTSSFSKIEIDGVVQPSVSTNYTFSTTGEHTVKYYLKDTSIGNAAFRSCSGLTSIDIPDSVTSISTSTFRECTGLTSIDIPDSVTSIGNSAFTQCTSLTSITVNATTPPTLGSAVFDGSNSCQIYVPCESAPAYRVATNWSNYSVRIYGIQPCQETYKLTASYRNGNLLSVVCDSNTTLTSGQTKPAGYTFTEMTSAYIGDCVTSIGGGAFDSCYSLTSIDIPDSVTSISEYAFYGCRSLTSIDIPSGVTYIGNQAFRECTGLTSIDIPDSVTSIGNYAFAQCRSLTSIDIPSGVTSIGNGAFRSCSGLTSITVESTTPPTLGDDTFYDTNGCAIYVPSGSVETYKSASGWSNYSYRILAITQV